ncbi:MAG: hypothetical protein LBN98_00590 [Prevotellaceae bacterium]|jgi:hypothetical protein|nr:hypothetical protein [Prevotellaceae bacterium]
MAELLNIKEASEWATKDIIFALTAEDIQYEARERLDRELTNDEISIFKKRFEYAIGENLLFIYPALFENFKRNELL